MEFKDLYYNFKRGSFSAIFEKYQRKMGKPNRFVLLKNVKLLNDDFVMDNVVLNETKGLKKLGELKPNTKISFQARIIPEFTNMKSKHKLTYPINFKIIKENEKN